MVVQAFPLHFGNRFQFNKVTCFFAAVRFGRVPKKEKARIIEQMQKSNLQMATTVMSSVMSAQDLVQTVILAHRQTSDLGQDKVKLMREIALLQNDYVDCPAHMVTFFS